LAGRIRTDEIGLAPTDEPVDGAYERDFYSWSLEQARLIRAGHLDAIDRENVAEEIESLGREQFNKLESALRVLLIRFLKWDHQPNLRSRSWILSIAAQRAEIDDIIGDNPGLKPRIDEAVARAYRKARITAARETDLEIDVFPERCAYAWDAIVNREFHR
jgi:predicted DNA-binding ribbon-helix-helix protein